MNSVVSVTEKRKTGRPKLVYALQLSYIGRHQREIGYSGCHECLEQRLCSPKVACIAHPKLHQASKAVLSCLPELAVERVGFALLEPPSLLRQLFLRVERDSAPFPGSCPAARRPTKTWVIHRCQLRFDGVPAQDVQFQSRR